jgi:type I restriction enzyme M protein
MARGRPKKDAESVAATPAKSSKASANGANLGFEAQLSADKLRKNLEPSDYKHVALGLIGH